MQNADARTLAGRVRLPPSGELQSRGRPRPAHRHKSPPTRYQATPTRASCPAPSGHLLNVDWLSRRARRRAPPTGIRPLPQEPPVPPPEAICSAVSGCQGAHVIAPHPPATRPAHSHHVPPTGNTPRPQTQVSAHHRPLPPEPEAPPSTSTCCALIGCQGAHGTAPRPPAPGHSHQSLKSRPQWPLAALRLAVKARTAPRPASAFSARQSPRGRGGAEDARGAAVGRGRRLRSSSSALRARARRGRRGSR